MHGKIVCEKPEAVQREKAFLRNLWPRKGFAFAGSHFSSLLAIGALGHSGDRPSVRPEDLGRWKERALRMTSYGVCAIWSVGLGTLEHPHEHTPRNTPKTEKFTKHT